MPGNRHRIGRSLAIAHEKRAQARASAASIRTAASGVPILVRNVAISFQRGVSSRVIKRAGQHVGMAVEIFGRRMKHDIGAELQAAAS